MRQRNTRVDIITPTECRIWFRLVGVDLELQACGDWGRLEIIPEWLGGELAEAGWDGLLSYPSGWRAGQERMEWALGHGIAPRQPFLMALYPPEYTKSWTDCGYEYDTYYYSDFLRVQPMPVELSAKRWERHLWEHALARAQEAAMLEEREQAAARRREQALQDVAALYLDREWYWGRGCMSDDPPGGLRVSLRSSYGVTLASGEDDWGSEGAAMARLLDAARKVLPSVRPEYIRQLPARPRVDRSTEAQR